MSAEIVFCILPFVAGTVFLAFVLKALKKDRKKRKAQKKREHIERQIKFIQSICVHQWSYEDSGIFSRANRFSEEVEIVACRKCAKRAIL